MESLGDILRRIRSRGQASTQVTDPPAPRCSICRDTGHIGRECAVDHPSFGKAYPCR